MSRTRTGATALALVVSLLAFGAGIAGADRERDRVVIEPPIFVPEAEFQHENGYYRTNEGHYYHYDRDRSGWHYGRNHDEGTRYEREHERRGEHRK
jgi:hypothetical protein